MGDILVRTTDLEITDRALGHGCSRKQFVIDVKTVAMVDSNGDWGEGWNSRTNQHENPGMIAAEQTKYRNMKLNLLTQATVLLHLFAHVLEPWGHLPSDIWGFWLCWN